jgi:hypothetical protein
MDQTKILSPNWLNHWLIVRDRTALFFIDLDRPLPVSRLKSSPVSIGRCSCRR